MIILLLCMWILFVPLFVCFFVCLIVQTARKSTCYLGLYEMFFFSFFFFIESSLNMSHVAVKSQLAKIRSEMVSSVFHADVSVNLPMMSERETKKKKKDCQREMVALQSPFYLGMFLLLKKEKRNIFFFQKRQIMNSGNSF